MLDCYNQDVARDVSITITTRTAESNNYFIMEKVKILRYGHGYYDGGVIETDIIPTISQSAFTANNFIMEKEPKIGVHPISRKMEFDGFKDVCPTLRATDYKSPHCVLESTDKVIQVGNTTPNVGITTRDNPQRGRVQQGGTVTGALTTDAEWLVYEGIDPNKVQKAADEIQEIAQNARPNMPIAVDVLPNGRLRPHIDNDSNYGIMDFYVDNENAISGTQIATRPTNVYGEATTYRIRKLTEREVFRLMDVSEDDINKLLNAKDSKDKRLISKSQCYKLGGNSICVGVLDEIFENMFFPPQSNASQQLTLF